MILGIGTAVPAGIIGGIFHMINNALYKSCLFLSGGAVEKQAGTTDLNKLGGLWSKMPLTFICFTVTALAISGVPPFNGFFSKELVYDGALERGFIFYLIALAGSFFTAASFLKLGHAAFLGKCSEEHKEVKEASLFMTLPMIILAVICIIFGVYNILPIKYLIQPILGQHLLAGHNFYGMPANAMLVGATIVVLLIALLDHLYGFRKTGKGLAAADHIHYAPGLHQLYDQAEKGWYDPYNIGMWVVNLVVKILYWVDRAIDWFYDVLVVKITNTCSYCIRVAHDGSFSLYIIWALAGMLAMVLYLIFGPGVKICI